MSDRLQALSIAGGRGRVACGRVAEFAPELAMALRRAVPFLARRRVLITSEPPVCLSFAELAADSSIVHVAAFTAGKSGGRGLVLVDETALGRILDGVLGGDGIAADGMGILSSAQAAFATKVSASMLRSFTEVLSQRLGIAVEPIANRDIESGAAVVVALSMDGGGRVLLALPLSAIRTTEPAQEEKDDPNIVRAMNDVELDLVAELGKVRLPLRMIAHLQVGDVIRLALPLDERARVCAGGAVLFHGRPTASGEVVAVALERQAG